MRRLCYRGWAAKEQTPGANMAKERTGEIIDLHREVSIGLLKSLNCFCVRTPRGQKDPGHLGWDPRTNSVETHRQNITRLERGDDNLGVHLFGNTVDIDVDTDNPYLATSLDYFLPSTPHVWGRGERTRTHRLYELSGLTGKFFDPSDFPFLSVIQKHENLKVEVRGGEQKNGRYSLLPGSLHPSGDLYQWDDVSAAKSTPISVDALKVLDSLRFALVTALIAPYWTEGVRNNLCMALSGFMYRAAMHTEDMGAQSSIYFTKKEARDLLEGLMYVADDDEADRQMRLRTFEQTWEKSEKGEATTGATTIAKLTGDPEILQILYVLLADTPDLVELDKFFDRYAVRNNTSNIVDLDRAGSKEASFIMTVNDFRNSNMHMNITSGSGARVQMTNVLLASPRAIRIDGFTFEPGKDRLVEEGSYTYVNQWRGYAIPPADEATEENVKPFLDYVMEVLANNKQAHYEWILAWLADMFKVPGDKCGTALVLVGKPGSGKSVLGEAVIRRIIGTDHSMQTNTLESITGNFNADSSSMLFVQCDEAANTRRRADANKMKSMITDKTRRVEPKNVNAFQVKDCARYLFTSNEVNDAVAIVDGRHDRRYGVFHVSERYAFSSKELSEEEKRQYWNDFHEWCDNRENLAKLHRYFLSLEYSRVVIRSPLDTEARRTIQQHSVKGFDEWMMTLATSEHPFDTLPRNQGNLYESFVQKGGKWENDLGEWPLAVPYRVLVDSYDYYRRRKGVTNSTPSFNEQQIKVEFQKRGVLSKQCFIGRVTYRSEEWIDGVPKQVSRRIRATEMPTRDALRDYVTTTIGMEFDEDGEEMFTENKPDKKEEF